MTEIRVTGAATRSLPADQATVRASARFADASRENVVASASALQDRVLDRLRAVAAAGGADAYIADPISTSSNSWSGEGGVRVVEHSAVVSVSVTLHDPQRVGELIAGLIEDGADADATWELSAAHRAAVISELRAEAVADARAAAGDYAAALGAPGIEITSVEDASDAGFPGPPVMRMAAAKDFAPEVTARDIQVSVRIDVRAQTASG
ncbi:SIMPL domain-containing protein [Leucobacter musarum]|uniref:SIMPL domain-containing protein n=1 Tax=Leucobacter musarum TaxID=1930747 RepID=UPI000A61862C|nr:SIMPL domain-containing protein [Leucobacter musarum]